jgi:hypothetical protein
MLRMLPRVIGLIGPSERGVPAFYLRPCRT